MDNAQRSKHPGRESQSVTRSGREVPNDWFVDPADPSAAQGLNTSTDDRATAYLAAHEAMVDLTNESTHNATVTALHPGIEVDNTAPEATEVWLVYPDLVTPLTTDSWPGKPMPYVPKLIRKRSFRKRVAPPATQKRCAEPAR